MSEKSYPIVIIGAGGIVRDAHLPAYQLAGYRVHGIYDLDNQKAKALASKYGIPLVYPGLEELVEQSPADCIFDLAVPGSVHASLLRLLRPRSKVLMQKPMGENLDQAKEILSICREKQLTAAVNFQLRYAPFVEAARRLMKESDFGDICDIEINVNVYTPWHLWSFLNDAPRVEILYHSIHYIDLVRSFLGNPHSVYAKTIRHPQTRHLASVRTNIIMDYGSMVRANILTNHNHNFGFENQQSYIKLEAPGGAMKITMGLLMDYPKGKPDRFQYFLANSRIPEWKTLEVKGSWFPHAFAGSMGELMTAANGIIERPDNSVEDAIHTMAVVEAAHLSDAQGGVVPEQGF